MNGTGLRKFCVCLQTRQGTGGQETLLPSKRFSCTRERMVSGHPDKLLSPWQHKTTTWLLLLFCQRIRQKRPWSSYQYYTLDAGVPVTAIRELRVLQSCKHPNVVRLKKVVTGSKPDRWGCEGMSSIILSWLCTTGIKTSFTWSWIRIAAIRPSALYITASSIQESWHDI